MDERGSPPLSDHANSYKYNCPSQYSTALSVRGGVVKKCFYNVQNRVNLRCF